MLDALMDTLLDSVKIIPFLFAAFLIIELIEHKLNKKTKKIISNTNSFGPILGGILGSIPQCGFSVMATNLYITRIITLGTLVSIYLSTSDEMLPILLSKNVDYNIIIKIISIKIIVGVISGFIIDFILRKCKKDNSLNYKICDEEHCDCNNSILKSTVKHTLKTLIFIMIITFALNILFELFGDAFISVLFMKNSIFAPFISSLIGLIPNCCSSIIITELYLNNVLTLSSAIAGLLTGSGVAILILFKLNKNIKENMFILGLIYFIGVFSGILLNLFKII